MCDLKGCGQASSDRPLPAASTLERRQFLKGMLALPLAVVLADPVLAQVAGARTHVQSLKLGSGREVKAHLALPEDNGPAPAVILIHEWWGLNDSIKAVANELAEQGFMALAVDLYHGGVAETREQALSLKNAVDNTEALATLVGWVQWLRRHERSMTEAGKADPEIHWYVADHAFANPTGARYDEEDAALAWSRSLAFLQQHLQH